MMMKTSYVCSFNEQKVIWLKFKKQLKFTNNFWKLLSFDPVSIYYLNYLENVF